MAYDRKLRDDQKTAAVISFLIDRSGVFNRRLNRLDQILDNMNTRKKKNKSTLRKMLIILYEMQAEIISYKSTLQNSSMLSKYFMDEEHVSHARKIDKLIEQAEAALDPRQTPIPREQRIPFEKRPRISKPTPATTESMRLAVPDGMINYIGSHLKQYQKQIDDMQGVMMYPLRIKDKAGTYRFINEKSKELINKLKIYQESLSPTDKKQLAKVEKQIRLLGHLIEDTQHKLDKIAKKKAPKPKTQTQTKATRSKTSIVQQDSITSDAAAITEPKQAPAQSTPPSVSEYTAAESTPTPPPSPRSTTSTSATTTSGPISTPLSTNDLVARDFAKNLENNFKRLTGFNTSLEKGQLDSETLSGILKTCDNLFRRIELYKNSNLPQAEKDTYKKPLDDLLQDIVEVEMRAKQQLEVLDQKKVHTKPTEQKPKAPDSPSSELPPKRRP